MNEFDITRILAKVDVKPTSDNPYGNRGRKWEDNIFADYTLANWKII